jgi:hypothetical protein
MRTTRLYIKVDTAWHEIDLFDNVTIPITYKVSDIRQFGSKTAGFSLDFDIPHTNDNAQTFGLNSDINAYETTFEVGRDYPAYLSNNGLTTFSGQFRLKKVIKKNGGKFIYYVGYLYGGAKTFVDELGTQTLIGNENADEDINFSEYDTPSADMTLGNFVQRLSTPLGWGLTLIDKTNKGQTSFVGDAQEWFTDECTPFVYVKHILDKIFEKTSYQYVSDFLTQDVWAQSTAKWADTIGKFNFLDLIYPYMPHNSQIHDSTPITSDVAQLSSGSQTTACFAATNSGLNMPVVDFIFHELNFDSSQYSLTEQNVQSSLASWKFIAPESGQYGIKINFPFELLCQMRKVSDDSLLDSRESVNPNQHAQQTFTLWMQIEKNGRVFANNQRVLHYNEALQNSYSPVPYPRYDGKITIVSDVFDVNVDNLQLAADDEVSIYTWVELPFKYYNDSNFTWYSVWNNNGVEYYPASVEIHVSPSNDNSIISISRRGGFYEGASFFPNCILNPKTTKIDFFNNILKMFNLYVEDVSGKTNYKLGGIYPENTLRIEPYEIFYNPQIMNGLSNMHDWTNKIDWETVEIRRIDDYLYNIQSFVKEQNDDYYNHDYNSTYRTPYGERRVKGKYCTTDDSNEIAVKNGAFLCGVVNSQTDSLQCPKAFALSNDGALDTKKEYSDAIFFLWRNIMPQESTTGVNTKIRLRSRLSSAAVLVDDYNCADTLNDGYGRDTANLNFGLVNEWYQNLKGGDPSNNDLYAAFYKKQYDAMTANDARILRARAFLTAFDIATLQMSDMIIVKGDAYHIGQILQWTNEKEPCEIELIKTTI